MVQKQIVTWIAKKIQLETETAEGLGPRKFGIHLLARQLRLHHLNQLRDTSVATKIIRPEIWISSRQYPIHRE
jgi:hypothetical protein